MVDFKASTQGTKGTLSIIYSDGESKTLQSNHPAYAEVLTYLVATPVEEHDEDLVREMANPAVRLGRLLKGIDPRFDFDMFTLSFEGFPLSGPLVDLIKDRLNNGKGDWERFARFLARLEANPSFGAKQALYQFVQANGLHILQDGRFVGHKAVDRDGKSQHSGPNNFVNGVLYGQPNVKYRVPHFVGTVVSKRRGDVDDSSMACSTGLHVGSLSYASGFAEVLLTVVVAPEDVVGGEYGNKFRTERYEVIGINERKEDFVGPDYEIVDRSGVLTPGEKAFAVGISEVSRDHEFADDEERAQYNSLPSVGRNLYDRLRNVLAKSHTLAYETALADFGTYEDWLAQRDRERAEQAAADAAAAEAAAEQARLDAEAEAEEARLIAEQDALAAADAASLEETGEFPPDEDPAVAAAATLDEQALVEAADEAVALNEPLEPDHGSNAHLAALATMEQKAATCEALAKDLRNPKMGHKPLARKWKDAGVTEASVRRWRKANGVEVTGWTKVKDALS